jgi:NAD(P)-dependent dehydrogenase (short-subunit alcohol dehydrogenase family)
MASLTNTTALVTGARGIGRAAVSALRLLSELQLLLG